MEFRIADTFTDSLARLTGDEQKTVKTTAFDLQMNPAHPGLQFHKLERAKDPNFWSIRVSRDVRIIVHRTGTSLLLCYVGHHDDSYQWAERRKLETHPKTGRPSSLKFGSELKRSKSRSTLYLLPNLSYRCSQSLATASFWDMGCRPNGCQMCGELQMRMAC